MDNCSVLHMFLTLSIMTGQLEGNLHEIQSSQTSHSSHLRVRRGWIWSQIFVEEEDPTPRKIGQLKSDYDTGDFTIKYILSGEGAGEIFIIDEYTGDIHTVQCLDREQKPFYILQAQAINRRSKQPVEPESEFIIKVQDINDNAPEFINEPYISSIPEMCPTGTSVIQVTATDSDDPTFGNNAKLIYSILQGEPYFSVEPKTDLYTFAISESAPVGTTVGRIMADDGDVGVNAKMIYSLEDLEGSSTFTIQTDADTQEGIVTLAQPLDYESKRRFVIVVEAINENIDTRFLSAYEFRDRTTLKITVTNVDEPPIFTETPYRWKVLENAPVGTTVGSVYARDTDTTNNPIRYSISQYTDTSHMFRIDFRNGTLYVAESLDRETVAWHNLTINAREISDGQLFSSVSVIIMVLDINDNMPTLSQHYQPYVCEDTKAGELIELISATDADDPVDSHHFYFSMVPDKHINPNFTIRDNQDNTAGILARRSSFTRHERRQYYLPVVIRDSGSPVLSGTITLTISVCACQPSGHCPSGGVEAQALALDISMQTVLGLSLCFITLAVLSTIMLAVRKYRTLRLKKLLTHKLETEEFSEKAMSFAIPEIESNKTVSLRPHPRRREHRLCREEVAASIRMSLCHSNLIGPEDEVFQQFIMERLTDADEDLYVPPFDWLHTYAFEGTGSATGSLSSLDSVTFDPCDEGPHFLRLTPWQSGAEDETSF
ncbi:cadherin-22 isoform X2 [Xyrauchen texanus]|uniref:cadherin-22 isoform X2 n=1 Tax=Xyrauchen texanus TaxID=154827 RepID=UPI002242436E|nr:cadherin-22 isoform X2 [Xyrauchen texanus]